MTLVVAVATPEGTWIGGERYAGSFAWTELATPKVFQLETEDHVAFAIGFAGAPRVAQTVLAVHAPKREDGSLHWWLTEYCDRIHERTSNLNLLADPHDGDAAHLAGHSGAVLAIEGHVFLLDSELSWEEPTRGYVAQGGAYEVFNGAYEVLLDDYFPLEAARRAWPYVQRRCHIGPLVDEITLPS